MSNTLRRGCTTIFLVALAVGCNDARPQTEPGPTAVSSPGSRFDPDTAATIEGAVHWEGPVPEVPPFKVRNNSVPGKEAFRGLVRERPNIPLIDPVNKGVAQAVIFLRGVDPQRSRPWDHPAARIELRDMRLQVFQGDTAVRTAFVRRGDSISMVSHDKPYHILHGFGADYFTYTLPEPDRPRIRRLDQPGRVELTSASGCYWMRGYLFVDDHPYYTRTDRAGRFRLDQVPSGRYEVVCWLPNWNILRQDRDPESCLVTRVFLANPLEQAKTVEVKTGQDGTVDFTVYTAAFAK